ncbi:hypothetical protein BKA93DRAFT_513500 [Sparassis latifolia]
MPAVTTVSAVQVSDDPQRYEDEHVHTVYDEIASHFSSTRYKPWPIIAQFLSSIPTGWVGLDSGTGNGKYLPLPLDRPGSVCTVGLDRSRNLLEIAQIAGGARRDVVLGDVLGKPWREGAFDYAISIATIHHLSTHARRKLAVQRLLQCIDSSHGRILIYVWAIEQDALSKRTMPPDMRPPSAAVQGDEEVKGRDVFVPWVLSTQPPPKTKPETKGKALSSATVSPGPREASRLTEPTRQESKSFNRYYHMFAEGELSKLVREATNDLGITVGHSEADDVTENSSRRGVEIVQDGWERSNYYVELRCWDSRNQGK